MLVPNLLGSSQCGLGSGSILTVENEHDLGLSLCLDISAKIWRDNQSDPGIPSFDKFPDFVFGIHIIADQKIIRGPEGG
jgi:hypothetical protein